MAEIKTDRLFMRVDKPFLKAIDDWRRRQPDIPSRSESIRRLVELGLKGDQKGRLRKKL